MERTSHNGKWKNVDDLRAYITLMCLLREFLEEENLLDPTQDTKQRAETLHHWLSVVDTDRGIEHSPVESLKYLHHYRDGMNKVRRKGDTQVADRVAPAFEAIKKLIKGFGEHARRLESQKLIKKENKLEEHQPSQEFDVQTAA